VCKTQLCFDVTVNILLLLHKYINIVAYVIKLKIVLFVLYGVLDWKH